MLYDYYWNMVIYLVKSLSQSKSLLMLWQEYRPNSKYKILNATNKCNYVTTLDWLHGYEITRHHTRSYLFPSKGEKAPNQFSLNKISITWVGIKRQAWFFELLQSVPELQFLLSLELSQIIVILYIYSLAME